jgi:hypothetical protein
MPLALFGPARVFAGSLEARSTTPLPSSTIVSLRSASAARWPTLS